MCVFCIIVHCDTLWSTFHIVKVAMKWMVKHWNEWTEQDKRDSSIYSNCICVLVVKKTHWSPLALPLLQWSTSWHLLQVNREKLKHGISQIAFFVFWAKFFFVQMYWLSSFVFKLLSFAMRSKPTTRSAVQRF